MRLVSRRRPGITQIRAALECRFNMRGNSLEHKRSLLQITCGSADRMVNVWDVASRKLVYKLPGHNGSVNDSVFHPTEPIICSASSDRQLYLGELTT